MSIVVGLPHQKRADFIRTLTPRSQPKSRLTEHTDIVLPDENFMQRKRDLMDAIHFSRNYIAILQWNADRLPEVKQELWRLIKAEQQQIRATFNELVALKRWLHERIEDAEKG